MTRYLLIEDEHFAADEILRMMGKLRPDYRMAGHAESVEQAVALIGGGDIGLIIADIQLADGLSFEIFDRCSTDTPIIFTTAYDEYALKAFKTNSVDYLLKPIDEMELDAALCKFERHACITPANEAYARLYDAFLSGNKRNRFLVQSGDTFRHVETRDIAYFYSEDKYVYLKTFAGRSHIVDHTLEQLCTMLDGEAFFRVSRNCIANISSIKRISKYFAGRLKLTVQPECPHDILVSRSRVADFLQWVDGVVK